MPTVLAGAHLRLLKSLLLALLVLALAPLAFAQQKQQILWEKMQAEITRASQELNGVMGVAIVDLTSGQKLLMNPDEVFAQATRLRSPFWPNCTPKNSRLSPAGRAGPASAICTRCGSGTWSRAVTSWAA